MRINVRMKVKQDTGEGPGHTSQACRGARQRDVFSTLPRLQLQHLDGLMHQRIFRDGVRTVDVKTEAVALARVYRAGPLFATPIDLRLSPMDSHQFVWESLRHPPLAAKDYPEGPSFITLPPGRQWHPAARHFRNDLNSRRHGLRLTYPLWAR
jgi:hypothetical protein